MALQNAIYQALSNFGKAFVSAVDAAAARSQLGFTSTGSAVATATDPAAARTAIGLGSMATQNANAVAITGGSGAFTGPISTTDTTPSTSTTTGAITAVGGVSSQNAISAPKFNLLDLYGSWGLTAAASAPVTFYVNPATGNDNNSGSAGSPFLTVNKAISVVSSIYWGPFIPVIWLQDGTYTENQVTLRRVFAPEVFIRGNPSNPSAVIFDSTGGGTSPAGRCFTGIDTFSKWRFEGITFISSPNRQCIYFKGLNQLRFTGECRYSAGSEIFYFEGFGCVAEFTSATITLIDTANTIGFYLFNGASINLFNATIKTDVVSNFSVAVFFVINSTASLTNNALAGAGSITGRTINASSSYIRAYNVNFGTVADIYSDSTVAGNAVDDGFYVDELRSLNQTISVEQALACNQFFRAGSFTVAQLQAGLTGQTAGATAYCSNESGGATPVFFDGTNWRRFSDRQPVNSAATGRRFYFEDGSYLQPNANGDLVFTSKNNNTTTMALA